MSPTANSCSRMPSATVPEVIRTAGLHQRSRRRRKPIIRVTSLETVIPADVRSAASAVLAFAVGQAPGDTSGLCRIRAETGRLKWHPAGQSLFEAGL
jgi:hypothetical protein